MTVVNIPHASSAIATVEAKEIIAGQSSLGIDSMPATKEYYKFFDDIITQFNALESRLSSIEDAIGNIEARLTAGGL